MHIRMGLVQGGRGGARARACARCFCAMRVGMPADVDMSVLFVHVCT